MLKQLKKNQGLVLVVVLMIVIVMTAITLSLISLNSSQVNVAEQEVRRIQSEPIATGWLINKKEKINKEPSSSYVMVHNTGL